MATWERQARLDLEALMGTAGLTNAEKTDLSTSIDGWADKLKKQTTKSFSKKKCKVKATGTVSKVSSIADNS